MSNYAYLQENLDALRAELAALAAKNGTGIPRLVAVTKSGTDEELLALAACGVTDIGENRPQELARRKELLAANGFCPAMHEIGSLQKNKVRLIAPFVSMIHSLDSLPLAKEIEKRAAALDRRIPVLIEVNSAREPQKGGVLPEEVLSFADAVEKLPHLALSGLMTMGPAGIPPEELRPYFSLTRKLYYDLKKRFDLTSPTLSMGMSDSYAVAVEEGSTLVRVGRKLFMKKEC